MKRLIFTASLIAISFYLFYSNFEPRHLIQTVWIKYENKIIKYFPRNEEESKWIEMSSDHSCLFFDGEYFYKEQLPSKPTQKLSRAEFVKLEETYEGVLEEFYYVVFPILTFIFSLVIGIAIFDFGSISDNEGYL